MEDINDKLDQLLNDPNIGEKLNKALAGLGLSPEGEPSPDSGKKSAEEKGGFPDMGGLFDLSGVDLGGLLGMMSTEDSGQRLLRALVPYLRPSRRKRVEEAERLMAVYRLLPVLTGGGKEKSDEASESG